MEKDESATERLVHIFQEFEREVDEAVHEIMGVQHPEPANSPEPSESSIASPPSEIDSLEGPTSDGDIPYSSQASASDTMTKQPIITPEQKQMIAALNSLPQLKKYMAYFPNVSNAHGTIVCRDVKWFPHHKTGEREKSIFFRGYRNALRDQDAAWIAAYESVRKGYDDHKTGEGVLRHWVDHFTL
jgi:hypothetical protein